MRKIYARIVWFFVLVGAVASGVYLGVKALDNEKQTKEALQKARVQRKAVQTLKNELLQELQTNAGQLGLSYDYHQVMKDTLNQLLSQKEGFRFPAQLWKGIAAPTLRSAQYKTSATTQQLALLAPPLPAKLAHLYDLQQQLALLDNSAKDYWWQQEINRQPQTTAKALLELFTRYCVLEQKLDRLYNEVFMYIRVSKSSKTDKEKK